jgi:hypothetical protein
VCTESSARGGGEKGGGEERTREGGEDSIC